MTTITKSEGVFITIEGPDGAGKSTQLKFIKEFLSGKESETVFTREPGGTEISENIRNIILDKENTVISPQAEALLYAAARAQLVSEVIRPALAEGKTVICDRYVDSSIAYQGYGRELGESIELINQFATSGCMPDLTVLLKVDPTIGRKRRNGIAEDRMEMEAENFHQRVYEGYLELEKKHPQRILGMDGTDTIENISKKIKEALEELL